MISPTLSGAEDAIVKAKKKERGAETVSLSGDLELAALSATPVPFDYVPMYIIGNPFV